MRNEGPLDRILRIIAGTGLISLAFIGPASPWGWIGLVPLLTGIFAYCPLYQVLGLNTCPLKAK